MIFLYFKEQAIYNVNLSSQCNTCSSTFASYLVLTLIKQLSVLAINKSLFGFKKKDVNKKWLFCICKNKNQWFSVETITLESRIINYMYFSLSCMIDF